MPGVIGAIVGQEAGAVGGREASGAIAKHFGVGKNGQEVARNVGSRVGRLAGRFLPLKLVGLLAKERKGDHQRQSWRMRAKMYYL